jgi:GAF domain-containing protein
MGVQDEQRRQRARELEALRQRVAELEQSEVELQQRTRELSTILEATRAVSSTLDLEKVLLLIAEQMVKAVDADGCTLSRWDREADAVVTWVEWRGDDPGWRDLPGTIHPLADLPVSRAVLRTRGPVSIQVGDPGADPAEMAYLERVQSESLLMLPLVTSDVVIGLVELDGGLRERGFSADEIGLCQALADQAAVAIEQARLYQESRRRADELSSLLRAGSALSSSLDAQEILDVIVQSMASMLDATSVYVCRWDKESQRTTVVAECYGPDAAAKERVSDLGATYEETWVGEWLEQSHARMFRLGDLGLPPGWREHLLQYGGKSVLFLPVVFWGRSTMYVEVWESRYERTFTDSEVLLAQGLANQAAIALENARLYEQAQQEIAERSQAEMALQRSTERLRILHEIGQSVLAARSSETIAVAAIRRIRRMIPCQRAMVLIVEGSGSVRMLASESSRDSEPLTEIELYEETRDEQTLNSGWVYGVEDLEGLRQPSPLQQRLYENGVRSYAIVPLYMQGELMGTLNLESERPRAFSADDIAIAIEVAASLAVAIRQVRLYERAQQEIAERRRVEEQLREYASDLTLANAELDAFAHTVAHQLRGALSPVVMASSYLLARRASSMDQKVLSTVQRIHDSGHRMNSIIGSLLLLADLRTETEIEMVQLNIGEIVTEAQGRLAEEVTMRGAEFVLPERWPVALGYGPWVEEVWVNYLSNALKYGGDPPLVELGADPESDGTVRFWVRDNGRGLTREELDRLFVPFTRISQAQVRGHGLGLSIVRRIVERLGGQVSAESEGVPGRGCTFGFTLPAKQD